MNNRVAMLFPILLPMARTLVRPSTLEDMERTCIDTYHLFSKQCPNPTYMDIVYRDPNTTGTMELWQFQQQNCQYSVEKIIFLETLFLAFLTFWIWIWVLVYLVC